MVPRLLFLVLCCFASSASAAAPEPPRAASDQLKVELVAMEPEVRTPTALAVDASGRIYVLENNTHFRPKNYNAPPTDRVLVMEDFGPDGRAQKISTFADGFSDGMGLVLAPGGKVIVTTRSEVFCLRDTNGDGTADERTPVLKMDTKADYPHNGLSGTTLGPDGHLYIGLGENHGIPWTITGTDGSVLRGSDEGGIFRCTIEGGKVQHWAIGLWNPYGLAFDAQGRLFALDNDPGGGSLCRLLHIVRGGDYGYRYRYSRTTEHPFLSWFGQIPGTLPPVCLSGEAPTGLLIHAGQLLGATWTDHGVQRFPLEVKGASVTSKPEWFVRGDDQFRPSGIAAAPDGSLVISDWVDGAYEVHGKGRVWRVRGDFAAAAKGAAQPTSPNREGHSAAAAAKMARLLDPEEDGSSTPEEAVEILRTGGRDAISSEADPFLTHAAIERLARVKDAAVLHQLTADKDAQVRLGSLLALRRQKTAPSPELMERWLSDADGVIRRAALQWISEEQLTDFQPKLELALAGDFSRGTFQAYLATVQFLTSGKPDNKATAAQTIDIALDKSRTPELRALALRLSPVDHAKLTIRRLRDLATAAEEPIHREAVRILAARKDEESQAVLREIARDAAAGLERRAEAVAGLAHSAVRLETRTVLREILRASTEAANAPLAREALRSLGSDTEAEDLNALAADLKARASQPTAPADEALRQQLQLSARLMPAAQVLVEPGAASGEQALQTGGNAAAGRRVFYHPTGARCFSCHTIEGRGTAIGPDLTQMGRFTPEQIAEAIIHPSKEIAPAYVQWLLKLRDGREVSGINLFEDNKSAMTLLDATGTRAKYQFKDMLSREELPVSLMPPGLEQQMTPQDLRDLIAYLRESRD